MLARNISHCAIFFRSKFKGTNGRMYTLVSVYDPSTNIHESDVEMTSDIHPELRTELARTYRIHNWIGVVFRELVAMPFLRLTLYHVYQMGLEAYRCLV